MAGAQIAWEGSNISHSAEGHTAHPFCRLPPHSSVGSETTPPWPAQGVRALACIRVPAQLPLPPAPSTQHPAPTLETQVGLNHKLHAPLPAALRQLLELLQPQCHSVVGHRHWIAIHCQGAAGRAGRQGGQVSRVWGGHVSRVVRTAGWGAPQGGPHNPAGQLCHPTRVCPPAPHPCCGWRPLSSRPPGAPQSGGQRG